MKEPCNPANILTTPDPRTFWTNDDSGIVGKIRSGPAMHGKRVVVSPDTEARFGGSFVFAYLFVCLYPVQHLNILHNHCLHNTGAFVLSSFSAAKAHTPAGAALQIVRYTRVLGGTEERA